MPSEGSSSVSRLIERRREQLHPGDYWEHKEQNPEEELPEPGEFEGEEAWRGATTTTLHLTPSAPLSYSLHVWRLCTCGRHSCCNLLFLCKFVCV